METPLPSQHQLDTLRLYSALIDLGEDWGGHLVLACGADCALSGVPAATSIAGGASLAVDPDRTSAKSAMRAGELDFVVNTLDEAMRTLKNEVRQRRPLSVGLTADLDAVLGEMVERGIQPDLLLVATNQPTRAILESRSIQTLATNGMKLRLMADPKDERSGEFAAALSDNGWNEVYLPATNAAELRLLDERLLAVIPTDDRVRRRWIQQVPKYLREARSGGRWIWLSDDERERFNAAESIGEGEQSRP